jgi:hypothetical protein
VRTYRIYFTARVFRRLPWPTRSNVFEKRTTWQDAQHLAQTLADGGCTNVVVALVAQEEEEEEEEEEER